MGDLFHEDVHPYDIMQIFEVMGRAKQHVFLILTKRPKRVLEVWNRVRSGDILRILPNGKPGRGVEVGKADGESKGGMVMATIDIDSRIDYRAFYEAWLKLEEVKGNRATAFCPFHTEGQRPNLSIDLKTGKYKCFSCQAQGNAYTFLKEHVGMTKEEAVEYIRVRAGLPKVVEGGKGKKTPYTVEEYARTKKLPVNFLLDLGLKNSRAGGTTRVMIPYLSETGEVAAYRYRNGPGSQIRFTWQRGTKAMLYGLWRLKDFRAQSGELVLVEGESDTHTLWYHGIPALGIPGATTFKPDWAAFLKRFTLYLCQDADEAGDTCLDNLCRGLHAGGWSGELYAFRLPGFKDASEMHCADPDRFKERWAAAIESAARIDIRARAAAPLQSIEGAPSLRTPPGWRVDESGIYKLEESGWVKISHTPMFLSRKLDSLSTGMERVELKIGANGTLKTITTSKSTIAQTRTITQLADYGANIHTGNAKHLVEYFSEMEGVNKDLLPAVRAVDHLGWIDGTRFLPGLADDIALDVTDTGSLALANAYRQNGRRDEWIRAAEIARKYKIARLMLAAAFASPLIHLLGQRIFILHAWGPSRGGKTAALKAALSVWGDPEGLMASFNATRVGLERMASFYCDLPLGIDERQVVGDKQAFIEGLVYLLGLGKGKARGAKGGGLQNFSYWRTLILTTGEEPITAETSNAGVKTRTLEFWGNPVESEQDAQLLHEICGENYGFAGPEFIRQLVNYDRASLKEQFKVVTEALREMAPDKITTHLDALALLTLADSLYSQWVLGMDEDRADDEAIELVISMLDSLESVRDLDMVERAWEHVQGWLTAYEDKFTNNCQPPRYGYQDTECWYVIPQFFEREMRDAGFNPRRVLIEFAEKGWIKTAVEDGEKRYRIRKKIGGSNERYIGILKLTGNREPTGNLTGNLVNP